MGRYLIRIALLFVFCGVALPALPFSVQPHQEPTHVKVVVPFDMDLVWQWVLRSLSKYRVDQSDFPSKTVTTQWIKEPYNSNLFAVYNYYPYYEEVRTRLHLRLQASEDKISTIVNIFKDFEYFQNVFKGWVKLEPDGVEEYIIGYRIRQLAYYHYIIAGKKKEQAQ